MFYIYADGESIYRPSDASRILISPRLTLEIGKAGSLEFSVPPTHKFYDQLRQLKTLITVELDDVEIFRGRVLSNTRDFNNIRKVYCEGDLAYLVDSVQQSRKYVGTTHDLFRKIIAAHNEMVDAPKRFEVGRITIENREVTISGQSDETSDPETGDFDYKQIAINSESNEWKTSFDYIENCITAYCGGYLRTRREGGITYIDLLESYGNRAVQEIQFGRNMLDLTEEITAEDLFTVLIPLGDENLTIASVNQGSIELVDEEGVALYGRIVKTQVFDSVNKPSTLLENGRHFLREHANIPVTITIGAVDLHLIDGSIPEIFVGDIVHVNSQVHSLVEDLTCTKIEYDIEKPANNSYTFGNPKQSLTERYRKDKARSGGSGAGSGAGGAGGAGKAAEEKAKQIGDKFFDAWINVDESSAHIDLGAVYKELQDTRTVLQNQVGIDLNAVTGNINIQALKTLYDDLEQVTRTQAATIDVLTSDTQSKIDLVTSYYDKLAGIESDHYASLTLRADANESAIEAKADRVDVDAIQISLNAFDSRLENTAQELKDVTVDLSAVFKRVDENENAIRENSASIDLLANDLGSRITLETKNIKGDIAALVVKTDQQGSSIEANARNITLNANKMVQINADIVEINSDIRGVKNLVAQKLSTDELSAQIAAISGGITTKGLGVNGGSFYVSSGNTAVFNRDVNVTGSLTVNSNAVALKSDLMGLATQSWVQDQLKNLSVAWSNITGKPNYFMPKSHRHDFSFTTTVNNEHTHVVDIGSSRYISSKVSAQKEHKISVSGHTTYTGG